METFKSYTATEFLAFYPNVKFYLLLSTTSNEKTNDDSDCEYDTEYDEIVDGTNPDITQSPNFNPTIIGTGIYFCTNATIQDNLYLHKGTIQKIEITIPQDALVSKDNEYRFKTNKINTK